MNKNIVATWSGGKDSCFAMYKMLKQGYNISCILNTVSEDYKRVRFHGLKAEHIQLQSQAMVIPLIQKETNAKTYGKDFRNMISLSQQYKPHGLVFGDIHLQDCYEWAENICNEFNLKLYEPLWKVKQEGILLSFIKAGFEAIIVSTQVNILGKEWIGRKIDFEFIKDLKKLKNVDLCGENGEYHTFVLNGPIFKRKLVIQRSEIVKINGYYFLNIEKIKTTKKYEIKN